MLRLHGLDHRSLKASTWTPPMAQRGCIQCLTFGTFSRRELIPSVRFLVQDCEFSTAAGTAASRALFGTLYDELDVEARSRFIQAYGYVVKEINGGVFRSNAALRRGPRRKRERRAHSCSRATKATQTDAAP